VKRGGVAKDEVVGAWCGGVWPWEWRRRGRLVAVTDGGFSEAW